MLQVRASQAQEHYSLFPEGILPALCCRVVKPLAMRVGLPLENLIVVNSWPIEDNFFSLWFLVLSLFL